MQNFIEYIYIRINYLVYRRSTNVFAYLNNDYRIQRVFDR